MSVADKHTVKPEETLSPQEDLTSSSSPIQLGEFWTFFRVPDTRFEAYTQRPWPQALFRDIIAAVIVSFVSIPLGIGFALASGLSPEQGIVAGAFAGILGGAFGGSKYQVYGPTAAFITTIAAIVHHFSPGFLILATIIAGFIIMGMAFFRLGKWFQYIPNSVVVGFTLGISVTIILGQMPDLMGGQVKHGTEFLDKVALIPNLIQDAHGHALLMGVFTFMIINHLYRISIFIPAPLIAIVFCTFMANEVWQESAIPMISSKFGNLSPDIFQLYQPSLGAHSVMDLFQPVAIIVIIAALESLLSAKMANRIANETTPVNANKELFGQGLVNIVVPLLSGFPCTGALARSATNIKVGALSPLASIFQGCVMITMMLFFAPYLSSIPMASIAGLLVFVALNMVKPAELRGVWKEGMPSFAIMLLTAMITLFSDLFIAVASGTILFFVVRFLFPKALPHPVHEAAH